MRLRLDPMSACQGRCQGSDGSVGRRAAADEKSQSTVGGLTTWTMMSVVAGLALGKAEERGRTLANCINIWARAIQKWCSRRTATVAATESVHVKDQHSGHNKRALSPARKSHRSPETASDHGYDLMTHAIRNKVHNLIHRHHGRGRKPTGQGS